MASKNAPTLCLLLVISMTLAISMTEAKTANVGGASGWNLGVNFASWASANGPFAVGDTLVFQFGPPHTVVLLPDQRSFQACDLSKGRQLSNQGGFRFVINDKQPKFFACGAPGHCQAGMKLSVAAS